ncbi:VOC family protein [Fulvivirga kasyanovii]|uniref:Bleomycin resistance protein n=1 Tax=Fulvivirga kasyanovii TaxID=396812 RepID=A0ABW9RLZ5_9BACT|nr:VOC family protein [Fulvivirga kasyanovii]MTI24970.1 bleomycin resistance protein [Fulvivirga kasyanovii]
MKNQIGRMVILVEDYDQALNFYQSNFGFNILHDVTTDVGQRFLHIGTGKTDALGIWFLKADGKKEKERIGSQTAGQPALVIYTDTLKELYNKLKDNGVKMKTELVITPEYKFFHCFDLYGNEIVVVQLD